MEFATGLVDVAFKLLSHLRRSYRLSKSKELRRDIKFILRELRSIQDAMRRSSGTADDRIRCWIADLNEIRKRIEDSVEFHNLKVSCMHHNPGAFRKIAHRLRTRAACKKLHGYIEEIKQLVIEAKQRVDSYELPQADETTVVKPYYRHANEAHPVGLESPTAELVPLLSRGDGSERRRVVLGISAPGGSGKTVFAKELYRVVQREFDCRAWVTATDGVENILSDLVDQFGVERPSSPSQDLSELLREYLLNKRYIIIVDDLQTTVGWDVILHACPDNDMCSRIILTTTNDQVARSCRENCQVHKMQPLDEDSAGDLFQRKVFGQDECPNSFKKLLPMILKTCEYLPLLIVNMADYVRSRERWDSHKCVYVCKNIGSLLVSMDNEAFVGMKTVFHRSYNNLNHNERICLLSLSAYPKDHDINSKSLIRQWLADGLILFTDSQHEREVANECLAALVNHNFILPKKVGKFGQVKTFRVRQIVLEFIKDKANSENFVTWIDTHVRSFTLSGHESKALVDFRYYEFLRRVDLENCENLSNENLGSVCRLSLIKYLSIRGSKCVSKLPRKIVKLRCLESLDIRDTEVDKISMEVILLPELAELFGNFKITCNKRNLRSFISKKNSKLHTLSGIFFDESQCFIKLLPHMPRLSKVKILCRRVAPSNEVKTSLLLSLKEWLERELCETSLPLQSLSIDFGDVCDLDFLDGLEVRSDCLLRSLKLCGKLTRLPRFIQSTDIESLCLSRTNLGVSVLSELQGLQNLECLKLTEDDPFRFKEEEFICHSGWFVHLKYLCLDFPEVPKIVIEKKGMQGLETLQLFCTELAGFSGMEHLIRLEEVILHPDITRGGENDLLKQVSSHPMRPKIILRASPRG